MSQCVTVYMKFKTEKQADRAGERLAACDRLTDVQNHGYTTILFDTVLSGIYRTEDEFWLGVLKPALGRIKPISVEFTIPPTDYSETIYP